MQEHKGTSPILIDEFISSMIKNELPFSYFVGLIWLNYQQLQSIQEHERAKDRSFEFTDFAKKLSYGIWRLSSLLDDSKSVSSIYWRYPINDKCFQELVSSDETRPATTSTPTQVRTSPTEVATRSVEYRLRSISTSEETIRIKNEETY